MKFTIKIDKKSGVTYFPKEIRQAGFIGEVEGLPSALTFILIKPGTELEDVEKSLKIVLKDISLQKAKE